MCAVLTAIRTLDCASKVRIHYFLAQPIGNADLSQFQDADIAIQEFSKVVQGAKDHFTITFGKRIRATGVIGESKIVVTYGKTAEECVNQDISRFENCLAQVFQ